MRRVLPFVVVALLVAASSEAQIPLDQVQVVAAEARVLQFPRSAMLERVALGTNGITLATSGTAAWPAVVIGGTEPTQAATLWVFLQIGGTWYATGAERLRPSQLNGPKPENVPPSRLIGDWLEKPEFGAMQGYNPRPGERVGLMVVAGSTRLDRQTPVEARSQVLEVAWPGDAGADPLTVVWSEGDVTPPTPPEPPPAPDPTVKPLTVDDLDALLQLLADHDVAVRARAQEILLAVKALPTTCAQAPDVPPVPPPAPPNPGEDTKSWFRRWIVEKVLPVVGGWLLAQIG